MQAPETKGLSNRQVDRLISENFDIWAVAIGEGRAAPPFCSNSEATTILMQACYQRKILMEALVQFARIQDQRKIPSKHRSRAMAIGCLRAYFERNGGPGQQGINVISASKFR